MDRMKLSDRLVVANRCGLQLEKTSHLNTLWSVQAAGIDPESTPYL